MPSCSTAGFRSHERVRACVLDDERLAGRHDVLAERVRHGRLPRRGERLRKTDAALEELAIVVDERNETQSGRAARHATRVRRSNAASGGVSRRSSRCKADSRATFLTIDRSSTDMTSLLHSYSHPERRNPKKNPAHAPTINSMVSGYPNCQCSSGIVSKFMP